MLALFLNVTIFYFSYDFKHVWIRQNKQSTYSGFLEFKHIKKTIITNKMDRLFNFDELEELNVM